MDLSVRTLPNLTLRDPFIIASSHWSANENCFRNLSPFRPSALTLKTTSGKGGDGTAVIGERKKRNLEDAFGNHFATFTDGAKTVELLDSTTTIRATADAKKWLPDTLIGLSILSGEDYSAIAKQLRLEDYAYVELNLKYMFRGVTIQNLNPAVLDLIKDLNHFFSAFANHPKFIKLPREFTSLIAITDLTSILEHISKSNTGLIIANSKRILVPPSRTPDHDLRELINGVVVGEYLYLDTYHTIRVLSEKIKNAGLQIPIIASGGIMDIGAVVDIFAAGAVAVQLCTVLDVKKPQCIPLFRQQLCGLVEPFGSLHAFKEKLSVPEVWHDSAVKARAYRIDIKDAVSDIFSEKGPTLSIFQKAISEECADLSMPASVTSSPSHPIPQGLRFVFTKGNVSSYLLAKSLIEANLLTPLEHVSATEFCKELKKMQFEWDLGILPESTLQFLEKQSPELLGNRTPIRLYILSNSIFEVVGIKESGIGDIQKVYHFNGTSARQAMCVLLKHHHVESEDLSGPGLVPLLRCWMDTDGILAKAPLTRLYGFLCTPENSAKWKSLWSLKEPMWFVASKAFSEANGNDIILNNVAKQLDQLRTGMLSKPEVAVRQLRSFGLLDHCRRLLEGVSENKE